MTDARLQTLLDRLNLPAQDLAQLTFCDGRKDHQIRAWADSLPVTRVNFVSTLLYQALPEIAHLQTSAELRLNYLETLRPVVQHAILGLARNFLNQPLILPEAARKTATVAQALQKHMSNGYLVAVRDLCLSGKAHHEESKNLLALAIHRAVTGLGLLLLRNYQLYTPIAGQLWTELHTLYQLAETLHLAEHSVQDPLLHHQSVKTIRQAYLRPLLLACARPNQMRQDEVFATYNALEDLSSQAQLLPHDQEQRSNLFAVILNGNRPPLYKSRLEFGVDDEIRELNTTRLVSMLNAHSHQSTSDTESCGLRNAFDLSPALTDHLQQAWNLLAQRSFEREEVSGDIEVTVGLTNIHFHMSGEQAFHLFLNQNTPLGDDELAAKIFHKRGIQLKASTPREEDPWDEAFDVGDVRLPGSDLSTRRIENSIRQRELLAYQGKHAIHQVPLLDVSPGGYCLEWQDEIPQQVKAGELIGVRDKGRQKWALGVVRWVQQTQGASQLGIQIIAPQAIPLGVAIVHKTGGYSEYLRALQLPALKAVNRPVTLLTNAISFREYSRVRLLRPHPGDASQHSESTVQLTRRVFSTGAFSQFTYRELEPPKPDSTDSRDDFDSVWQKTD